MLDWQPPNASWFVGGRLNASVNCIDRHVRGPRRNKAAIIWEGEPGDSHTLTYANLLARWDDPVLRAPDEQRGRLEAREARRSLLAVGLSR